MVLAAKRAGRPTDHAVSVTALAAISVPEFVTGTLLVLAFLPRLPEWDVRFPFGRRTYADIAAPRGPAELADRIFEIERQLWRAATGRAVPPLDPGFRRTYGFFDAAERLGRRAFGLN